MRACQLCTSVLLPCRTLRIVTSSATWCAVVNGSARATQSYISTPRAGARERSGMRWVTRSPGTARRGGTSMGKRAKARRKMSQKCQVFNSAGSTFRASDRGKPDPVPDRSDT